MTRIQILQEIEKLTAPERLRLISAALKTLDKSRQAGTGRKKDITLKRRLAAAAKALRKDYEKAGELTSFTALDADSFYA